MCLPAVAALFIIKPGMFQCRMYNLAFDKAWAQCCQPPSGTGMHLVLFCKEKGVFFDHKLAQAFRNWCRWWLGFVRLFKKWFESPAFNLSIWTWVGFDTSFPPLDVGGGISCTGHLSVSLAAMETGIFPILKLPHSSSYTPQNLLKAGGKGRLIKKKPYLPAGMGQERVCSKGRAVNSTLLRPGCWGKAAALHGLRETSP